MREIRLQFHSARGLDQRQVVGQFSIANAHVMKFAVLAAIESLVVVWKGHLELKLMAISFGP